MLSDDFKYRDLVSKARIRRVRTRAGEKKYDQKIGQVIRRDPLKALKGIAGELKAGMNDPSQAGRKKPAAKKPAARKPVARNPEAKTPLPNPKRAGRLREQGRDIGVKDENIATGNPKEAFEQAGKKVVADRQAAAAPRGRVVPDPPDTPKMKEYKDRLNAAANSDDFDRVVKDMLADKKIPMLDKIALRQYAADVRKKNVAGQNAPPRVARRKPAVLNTLARVEERGMKDAYVHALAIQERMEDAKANKDSAAAIRANRENNRFIAGHPNARRDPDIAPILEKIKADFNVAVFKPNTPTPRKREIPAGKVFDAAAYGRQRGRVMVYQKKMRDANKVEDLVFLSGDIKADTALDANNKKVMLRAVQRRERELEAKSPTDFGELPPTPLTPPTPPPQHTPDELRKLHENIGLAQYTGPLHNIVEDAAYLRRKGIIDDRQLSRLLDRALEREQEIEEEKAAAARAKRAQERKDKADEAAHVEAQRQYFANGAGSIGNAPEAGLMAFLYAEKGKGRFSMEVNGEAARAGAISPNWWVTDMANGEKWMLKGQMSGYDAANDPLNEVMAFQIQNAVDNAPKPPTTKLAGRFNNQGWIRQRHYEEHLGGSNEIIDNDQFIRRISNDDQTLYARFLAGDDELSPARMMVLDYLINNTDDRHQKNFLALRSKGDGAFRLGIIDQGMAFGNRGKGHAYDGSPPTFKEFYNSGWGGYRAKGWGLPALIRGIARNDNATLRKQLKKVVAGFDAVDVEHLREGSNWSTSMTPEQLAYVRSWIEDFGRRREYLRNNIDEMVNALAKNG